MEEDLMITAAATFEALYHEQILGKSNIRQMHFTFVPLHI